MTLAVTLGASRHGTTTRQCDTSTIDQTGRRGGEDGLPGFVVGRLDVL
ncbi:MAG: hypothetical protein HUU26_07565 [Gemmatimonadaceae bacterium]|nr:hypothetical protein [Gemmatimonadaceae bacterium]